MEFDSDVLPVHAGTVHECFAVASADSAQWQSSSLRRSLDVIKSHFKEPVVSSITRLKHLQISFFGAA
jgi:hypothetical protein